MRECHLSNVLFSASWWLGFVVSVVHMSKLDSWACKCDPHLLMLISPSFELDVAGQTFYTWEIWSSEGFCFVQYKLLYTCWRILVCDYVAFLCYKISWILVFCFVFLTMNIFVLAWNGEHIWWNSSAGLFAPSGNLCPPPPSPIHFTVHVAYDFSVFFAFSRALFILFLPLRMHHPALVFFCVCWCQTAIWCGCLKAESPSEDRGICLGVFWACVIWCFCSKHGFNLGTSQRTWMLLMSDRNTLDKMVLNHRAIDIMTPLTLCYIKLIAWSRWA